MMGWNVRAYVCYIESCQWRERLTAKRLLQRRRLQVPATPTLFQPPYYSPPSCSLFCSVPCAKSLSLASATKLVHVVWQEENETWREKRKTISMLFFSPLSLYAYLKFVDGVAQVASREVCDVADFLLRDGQRLSGGDLL